MIKVNSLHNIDEFLNETIAYNSELVKAAKDYLRKSGPFECRGWHEAYALYVQSKDIDDAIKKINKAIKDWKEAQKYIDNGSHVPGVINGHEALLSILTTIKNK
jgi:hypothetical protein